jgi:hypothetical protein
MAIEFAQSSDTAECTAYFGTDFALVFVIYTAETLFSVFKCVYNSSKRGRM